MCIPVVVAVVIARVSPPVVEVANDCDARLGGHARNLRSCILMLDLQVVAHRVLD